MIKRNGQTIVGDYPNAENYIDDTQARTDRMYSSSKVDSNLNYLKYKDIEENSKTIQELYNEQGTGARCYYSKFTDSPKANDQGYLTIVKNTMNYGSVTFMSNNAYWVRNLNGGTWSSWQRLVTESDLTPTTTKITFASGTSAEPSSCWYTVSGKICIVQLTSYTPSSASGTVANDLPKAKNKAIARLQGNSSSYCLIYVNDNGTRLLFANGSTSQTYTGQIMYTIAN